MSGSQGKPKRVREGRKQYSISLGENREAMETRGLFQELEETFKQFNSKMSRPQLVTYMVESTRMRLDLEVAYSTLHQPPAPPAQMNLIPGSVQCQSPVAQAMEYENACEGYGSYQCFEPQPTLEGTGDDIMSLDHFNPCKGDDSDKRFLSPVTPMLDLGETCCMNYFTTDCFTSM